MPRRSHRGQTIRDHNHQSAGAPVIPEPRQSLPATLIERPSQVRPQKILHPIPSLARNHHGPAEPCLSQRIGQRLRIERRMHCVSRPSVRQFKVKQRLRGNTDARTPQPYSRWRETSQPLPHIGPALHVTGFSLYSSHSLAPGSSLRSALAPNKAPCSLQIPIFSSQTSNSGARRSPSALRAYRAS